jgi:hypothetical protein
VSEDWRARASRLVGTRGPDFHWVVERGKAWEFAQACLAQDRTYLDPDATAPPTFLITATGYWWGSDPFPALGELLDLRFAVHGEQEFELMRPLRPGEDLVGTTVVADAYERSTAGRRRRFVVYETTHRASDGGVVAIARGTAVEVTEVGAGTAPLR